MLQSLISLRDRNDTVRNDELEIAPCVAGIVIGFYCIELLAFKHFFQSQTLCMIVSTDIFADNRWTRLIIDGDSRLRTGYILIFMSTGTGRPSLEFSYYW